MLVYRDIKVYFIYIDNLIKFDSDKILVIHFLFYIFLKLFVDMITNFCSSLKISEFFYQHERIVVSLTSASTRYIFPIYPTAKSTPDDRSSLNTCPDLLKGPAPYVPIFCLVPLYVNRKSMTLPPYLPNAEDLYEFLCKIYE